MPVPVFLKRLDAPLWVFSFGIFVFLGNRDNCDTFLDYHARRGPCKGIAKLETGAYRATVPVRLPIAWNNASVRTGLVT